MDYDTLPSKPSLSHYSRTNTFFPLCERLSDKQGAGEKKVDRGNIEEDSPSVGLVITGFFSVFHGSFFAIFVRPSYRQKKKTHIRIYTDLQCHDRSYGNSYILETAFFTYVLPHT